MPTLAARISLPLVLIALLGLAAPMRAADKAKPADKPKPADAAPVGETVAVDADSVLKYVATCKKPNGAYGPVDQEYTDLPWNFAAVWALQTLHANSQINAAAVLEHGLGGPAGHGGASHREFYQYHALRTSFDKQAVPAHKQVNVYHQGFVRNYYMSPLGKDGDLLFKTGRRVFGTAADLEAETFYYYNLSSLDYLVSGLYCSGRTVREPQPLIDYILRRQTAAGFNDAAALGADAHISHTLSAVRTLQLLGKPVPQHEQIIAFVTSCRDKTGGYRWNPKASLPGNEPDVYYTMCALEILSSLNAQADAPELTAAWLNSLHNADGGFGDRPGWRSRLESTNYAVTALSCLNNDARGAITTKQVPKPTLAPIPTGEFQIFQAQFKVPKLEPAELAGLSKRGLNLVGIKSYDFADVEKLLPAIESQRLPMDAVLCPEMYPHRLVQLGTMLNHVGNFTLDARWNAEQREVWKLADEAGRSQGSWQTYRDKAIAPIRALGGFVWPEQDFEMEYAYLAYDSGLPAGGGKGGYNAVLCGFNWPPKDFVRVFPWHERYTERLTTIADVDAHGDLSKWSEYMDTVRTLFIAKGPKYADFQEAAAAGRVVTVIAQPEGVPSGASYYGPAAAVEYVKQRRAEWQWWK